MTTFRWTIGMPPSGMPVRQVYGFCFDESGRVLLRDDGGSFSLPGGTPEPGEERVETLARECMEESQITIARPMFIGYQEVTDGTDVAVPPYAQLRYVATITGFLPRAVDPDSGRIYRRLLTPVNRAPALLDWGIEGLFQAAEAARAAIEKLGLPVGSDRTDSYVD